MEKEEASKMSSQSRSFLSRADSAAEAAQIAEANGQNEIANLHRYLESMLRQLARLNAHSVYSRLQQRQHSTEH